MYSNSFIKKTFAEYYERPAEVQMDITNKCNFDCLYCYNKGNSRLGKPELSDEKFLELVDKVIKELNPVTIVFTGGEPLMRKNVLLEAIHRCNSSRIRVAINTNGSLLTKETILELKNAGLGAIQTNLDAAEAAVYTKLRGGTSSYERQINTLKNLVEFFGADRVTIIQVVTKLNFQHLGTLSEFIHSLGFRKLKLLDFVPMDKSHVDLMLSKEEWLDVLKTVNSVKERMDLTFRLCHAFLFMTDEYKNIKFPFCMASKFSLFITADGSLFPCNHLKREPYYCGDVFANNLLDTWQNNPVLNKFRYYDYSDKKCVSCIKYKQCAGGCKALANVLKGDPFAGDPSCDILNYL